MEYAGLNLQGTCSIAVFFTEAASSMQSTQQVGRLCRTGADKNKTVDWVHLRHHQSLDEYQALATLPRNVKAIGLQLNPDLFCREADGDGEWYRLGNIVQHKSGVFRADDPVVEDSLWNSEQRRTRFMHLFHRTPSRSGTR